MGDLVEVWGTDFDCAKSSVSAKAAVVEQPQSPNQEVIKPLLSRLQDSLGVWFGENDKRGDMVPIIGSLLFVVIVIHYLEGIQSRMSRIEKLLNKSQ